VQNNQLNSSLRTFYKRFTCFLQLFTVKKPQHNWHPVSLLHRFTKSIMVMKICKLAFLLLFQFLLACNETVEVSAPSPVGDGQQKQKNNQALAANIVFKSADGGQTWQDISEGLPGDKLEGSHFVNERGFYLRTGNYIYHSKPNSKPPFWEKEIFPHEHSSIAPGKSGIFAYDYHLGQFRKKVNGSGEWSPVYGNFQLKGIIDIFETAAGTVFIVCDRGRGLFRSTDNGKNWKEVSRGVLKLAESNGVLMASSINGIIRSTDDGETWKTVISEGGVGIDIAPIDGGFAAITFNTQSEMRRVRTSCDGGITWQAIDAGLPPSMKISSIIQVGENFFCGHPEGIYKSSDKGKTWKLLLPSIENKVFSLFVSGNVIYAIATKGGC
jgi:photosystem II stability/assembly factor-like uncharacterized protein